MNDFKVGDFIQGVAGSGYSVTDHYWKGIVLFTGKRNGGDWEPDTSDPDVISEERMYILGLNNHSRLTIFRVDNTIRKFNLIHYSDLDLAEDAFKNIDIDPDATNIGLYDIIIDGKDGASYDYRTDCIHIENVDVIPKVVDVSSSVELKDFMFDKTKSLIWDKKEKDDMCKEIFDLFGQYEDEDGEAYNLTEDGVKKMLNISNDSKGWIEYWMSKHPNYNRKSHSISTIETFNRISDKEKIADFINYMRNTFKWYLYQYKRLEKPFSYDEYSTYSEARKTNDRILSALRYLPEPRLGLYDNKNIDYYQEEYDKYNVKCKAYEMWDNGYCLDYIDNVGNCISFTVEDSDEMYRFESFLSLLYNAKGDRITEREANTINNSYGYYEFVRAVKGQKWSTIVKKVAKHFHLTEHENIVTKEWTDETTGEVKSRDVDMGWNKQYTIFCDSIKPMAKEMKVVLSVNPYDFFTMSFGSSWASCQTIDKTNKRNGDNNYSGCYSGGTTDLAEDDSTVIMYLLPKDYDGDTPYKEDKIKRCLFYMGEDKFVQSRVYPDGRDGTDYTDVSKQMREIMENIINECSENVDSNMWIDKEKPDNDFMRMFVKKHYDKLHYSDYFEYPDIYVVRNKAIKLNAKKIVIGSEPTCLCCGNSNSRETSVICDACYEGIYCARCDRRINRDDAIEINGYYYCDDECAENDGWYHCEDTEDYRRDYECYQDDYNGYYYSNGDCDMVITEDGNRYHTDEHAESDGYSRTSDGRWYPDEEVCYCDICGNYVHDTNFNDEHNCCSDCLENLENEESEEENYE